LYVFIRRVIKQIVVISAVRVNSIGRGNYRGIINVDFDATGQILLIFSAFVKYFRNNGNTI